MKLPVPLLVGLALTAFAANSLLARLAMRDGLIDPASYTAIRLVTGALALGLLVRARGGRPAGTWPGAGLLALYAVPFGFAYLGLTAGMGALLLFGAVQLTMIGAGLVQGERPGGREWLGTAMAVGGLVVLVAPGTGRAEPGPAALMLLAGVAWGGYSLLGRRATEPAAATAGNFLLAAPLGLLPVLMAPRLVTPEGVLYATLAGAVASGLGYIAWYAALPALRATRAAVLQITVPVIAAWGGVALLGERLTLRLVVAGAVVLGGVWLATVTRRRAAP